MTDPQLTDPEPTDLSPTASPPPEWQPDAHAEAYADDDQVTAIGDPDGG